MKFGMNRNNQPSLDEVLNKSAASHPDAKENRAGGLSFSLDGDPSTKLLTMTGGQLFNEPTYYASNAADESGLSELARDVVNSAKAVTLGSTPQDILSIAHFLRVEKNIRTTPAVLYAIAAGQEKNRDRMVEYGPKILRRADDVLQAFAAYFALYGDNKAENGRVVRKAKLPNSFKKGLASALAQFDEYQLVKWDNDTWPRFKDVLQVIDRKGGYPVSKELLTYFITGEVVNPEATPIVAARKELAQLKDWNAATVALAKRAHVTWEILLSQFGNKKEVWEALIDGGKATLPVMAAVRNLRNMEQAGISEAHWDKVTKMILSHEDNKMMPFRFIAARNEVTTRQGKSVADLLLDKAAMNLDDVPGVTYIAVDVSGSMDTAVSAKSKMTKAMTAKALAAVLAKKLGNRVILGAFATSFATIEFSAADSAYRIYEEFSKHYLGGSTEAVKAIQHLIDNKIKVDRILLLSDMQCYTRGSGWGYSSASVQSVYEKYRQLVNSECRLVSVDLGGYGDSVVAKDSKVWLSTGYTESIVKEMLAHEGLLDKNSGSGNVVSDVPSMDYVRANY